MDGSYLMPKRVVLAIAAVAVLLLVLFAGVKAEIIRPNMVFVPEGVKGVGISEHQGAIDLKTLSNDGVEFVYAKATEGSSHVDSQFAATCGRASGCRAALGAYHFFSFDTTGAANEAGNVDLDALAKNTSVDDLLMQKD